MGHRCDPRRRSRGRRTRRGVHNGTKRRTATPRNRRRGSDAGNGVRWWRHWTTTSSSSAVARPAPPWRTGCRADPATTVLVLEAGRPDYPLDVFIHMPAALTFPIGSKYYDWMYESEPEPFMNGRRIYHARGKVLGGSSSINGMIFQRGNPLDYERWAADPGMGDWDYAHCLPYFKKMETCLAGGDEYRGTDGPLMLERGPGHQPAVRRVLRGGPAGGLCADRRRERLPPGGLRGVRPEHLPGPAAVRRPGLPPPGHEPAEPDRAAPRVRHPDPVRRQPGGRRRVRRPARQPGRGAEQVRRAR